MTDVEPPPFLGGADSHRSVTPQQSGAPRLVGLVADDLTGATDSAVEFAAAGWSAHLLRAPGAGPVTTDSAPSLLAVVTGVRPVAEDLAAARTTEAVQDLLARGCDRLYLKIDSTMRGSVAGQLRGALTAWSAAHSGTTALLCPAFPAQGRTIVDGRVLVDGIAVAESPAAADPVTPVVDSHLAHLVPGSTATTLAELRSRPPARTEGCDSPVMFVDAASDADLAAIAACVDGLGPAWVAAGSAGLAAAIARRWSAGRSRSSSVAVRPSGRILVGVSSLHPIALDSVETLRGAMTTWDAQGRPAVDVISTPAARADAATVAAGFGERVADQLASASYDALILVGGDGAAAALDRIGATAVTVHSALAPGVPLGAIVGGVADGVRVVTKSGGFGDADSLIQIIDRLQSGAHYRKESS